jgi:RNA-binding protein
MVHGPRPVTDEAPRTAPVLDSHARKRARGLAHAFEPLVHVGHGGISAGVVAAVNQALLDHELIKVRLHEPEDKTAMARALAEATGSALCGLVGHTVILYRPHPEKPRLSL